MKQWKKNGKYRLLGVVTACVMVFMSACAAGRTGENFSKCAAGDGSGVWDTAVRYFYGDHSRI